MNRKLFIVAQVALFALLGSAIGVQARQGVVTTDATGTQDAQPSASRDFEDVLPTNTFFNNIRSLYFAGIVGGYPCGGPGEPCGPENLPYYRPGASVSRGQMAKIADNSRKRPGIFIDTATDGQPIYSRTSFPNGRGIQGDSVYGNGVHGISASTTASGVYGENAVAGFGIAGRTINSGSAVFGDNPNAAGFAGNFNGNVRVQGTLSKAAGSFEIDHPLDPANKYLYHSFVESPDMMNIYNGNVTLDEKGEAVVQMPDWFEALNMEFRYQLTAIGAPGPNLYVAEEIKDNHFAIAGGKAGSKVSWQVTGIRHDPYAEQYRIPVEKDKPTGEKGTYLHPEVYGQPDSKRLDPLK
ncbi:MAG: hypothetical protein ABI670_03975 [Chloroflexota bacterium]